MFKKVRKGQTASSWSAKRVEIAVSGGMEKAVKYIANAAIVLAFILSTYAEDAAVDPEDTATDPEDDEMVGMKVGMTNIANKLPEIGAVAATSISAGMVQIAHELPDIGATASQSLERAATAVSGSAEKAATTVSGSMEKAATAISGSLTAISGSLTVFSGSLTVVSGSMERAVKYMANASMFVVIVLAVSRHFKQH